MTARPEDRLLAWLADPEEVGAYGPGTIGFRDDLVDVLRRVRVAEAALDQIVGDASDDARHAPRA